ncbi:MAG: SPOR domain-containing protein [Elusimicrobia bacterium]|nr:SPOR domain-containing protein [Elusimicrobiota bacterium]
MTVSAAFALLSLLTRHASPEVCQGHAFLLKYDCALTKVEGAARGNDPSAEYTLGYMYYYGIDTTKSLSDAKFWIRRAAAQGHPKAIEALRLLEASDNEAPAISTPAAVPAAAPVPAPAEAATAPLEAAPEDSFGIQLAASTDLARLREYAATLDSKGKAYDYKACIDGKGWFILIYGHYADASSATKASHALPPSWKEYRPFVKSYRTIDQQVEMRKSCPVELGKPGQPVVQQTQH